MNQMVGKKWERWLIGCLFAFLSFILITNCVNEKRADIALYSDQGTNKDCTRATQEMFEWLGYTVELIKADYINKVGLDSFRMLCVPGGDMYQYSLDISLEGKENVRDFIRGGGSYIGICGGAYFTGEKVFWQGYRLPMTPLAIFPGTTQGPINDIAPYPHCVMCEVNIVDSTHPIMQSELDSMWIIYCYGPMLLPKANADVDILGKYEIVNQPAIIAFEYENGRVFVIGTHPEFEEDSERDGVNFGDEFDDRGSDWELMRKAVHWCLRERERSVRKKIETNTINLKVFD
jgi:glutamine amidotransferase-like uncharacterized protein